MASASTGAGIVERAAVDGVLLPLMRRAPAFARAIRPTIVRAVWWSVPRWRRSLVANARMVLGPDASDADLRSHGLAVLDGMQRFIEEVVSGSDETTADLVGRLRRFRGLHAFIEARERRRGLIMVSIHMGPFETALAVLRLFEPDVHVVFARDRLRRFEGIRSRLRDRLGVIEAPVEDGVAMWTSLSEALARDEAVLMLGDRVQPGQPGVAVPFLGGLARLPTGPVKLAMISGAPIVPTYCWRDGDGVSIRIERPIIVEPGYERDLANHPAMAALVASMERAIRERPREWLAVHRVWPEQRGPESVRLP